MEILYEGLYREMFQPMANFTNICAHALLFCDMIILSFHSIFSSLNLDYFNRKRKALPNASGKLSSYLPLRAIAIANREVS